MANDLEEIDERLSYCRNELTRLRADLEGYCRSALDSRLRGVGSKIHLEVRLAKPLPTSIRILTGSIVHEARACLDSLACTLAIRHSGDCSGTYFPISKSLAIFEDDGRRKMRKLSPVDQKIIEDLKPYKGGDDYLYAMHDLDRRGKHIKLGAAFPGFAGLSVGSVERMVVEGSVAVPELTDQWTTAVRFSALRNAQFRVRSKVNFQEPPELASTELYEGVQGFLNKVTTIVQRFRPPQS